jgi:hypothetical protein
LVTDAASKQDRALVNGKILQGSLIFASKDGQSPLQCKF